MTRMSAAQFQAEIQAPKKNKFNAKKVIVDGVTFDSRREYKRYCENVLRLKDGEIADLKVHPVFQIRINGQKICQYTADSSYMEFIPSMNAAGQAHTRFIVEDVKSPPTRKKRDYRLVMKLMKAVHGIQIREVL